MESLSFRGKWIIFLALMVVAITTIFFFWENFLFTHYLGSYDQYGLPIQHSEPGYLFFLYAWPVWIFPILIVLAIGAATWTVWSSKLDKRESERLSNIQSQQEAIERLTKENEKLHKKLEAAQNNPYLKEKYHQLEKDFIALRYEYEESLNFIEKLLEKLPKSKRKNMKP